jgi:branched-chain amino acid transport system permease protein
VIFPKDQLQNILPLIIGCAGNFQTVIFRAPLLLILQSAPHRLWLVLFVPPRPVVPPRVIGDAQLFRRPGAAKAESLLDTSQLSKRFDRLIAVNNVDFTLRSGEIGLIGPNGAGKSTTFNLIYGALR